MRLCSQRKNPHFSECPAEPMIQPITLIITIIIIFFFFFFFFFFLYKTT